MNHLVGKDSIICRYIVSCHTDQRKDRIKPYIPRHIGFCGTHGGPKNLLVSMNYFFFTKRSRKKKIMAERVATNVVASRQPNGARLQRRPLVQIHVVTGPQLGVSQHPNIGCHVKNI